MPEVFINDLLLREWFVPTHIVMKWLILIGWMLYNPCECGTEEQNKFDHIFKHWCGLWDSYLKNPSTYWTVQMDHTVGLFLFYSLTTARFLELIITVCCSSTRHFSIFQEPFFVDMRNSWQPNLTHRSVLLALALGSEEQQQEHIIGRAFDIKLSNLRNSRFYFCGLLLCTISELNMLWRVRIQWCTENITILQYLLSSW